MPKAVSLTPDILTAPQITPAAATPPRRHSPEGKNKPVEVVPEPPVPLQVRLPRDEVRAIKVAAAQSDQTISDFMLACFHAYMKAAKHA